MKFRKSRLMQHSYSKRFWPAFASLILLLTINNVSNALENDRDQVLQIQADSAELDENKGTAIYRGSVELTQGSLIIKSDSLTIHNSEQGVNKVIAKGKPATYSQVIEENKEPVNAKATEIIYFPTQEKLVLSQGAELTQGGNLFEGNRIDYDIQKQILTADGGAQSSVNGSGRVKMVLPPTKKEKSSPKGSE